MFHWWLSSFVSLSFFYVFYFFCMVVSLFSHYSSCSSSSSCLRLCDPLCHLALVTSFFIHDAMLCFSWFTGFPRRLCLAYCFQICMRFGRLAFSWVVLVLFFKLWDLWIYPSSGVSELESECLGRVSGFG